MTYKHKQFAKGKWQRLSFFEQVANIGSEVERTINWLDKGNKKLSNEPFVRSLELFNLTLNSDIGLSKIKGNLSSQGDEGRFYSLRQ